MLPVRPLQENRALLREEVAMTAHGNKRACKVAVSAAPEAAEWTETAEA